ncbi:30S ribosomal protein S30e [Candidatus Bathyarchaeota archaeon]|jgi:small subunit ribosomal protein S30e|nr:30S ribosomal protein S30e [Candidatus Bathyarchaeota archaeon]
MPTHGSLTKAGKVRAQTPKIDGKPRKSMAPRRRNRSNYVKRHLAAPRDDYRRRRN